MAPHDPAQYTIMPTERKVTDVQSAVTCPLIAQPRASKRDQPRNILLDHRRRSMLGKQLAALN